MTVELSKRRSFSTAIIKFNCLKTIDLMSVCNSLRASTK